MRRSRWPSSSFPHWTTCRRQRWHGRSLPRCTLYQFGQPFGYFDNARRRNDEGVAFRRVYAARANGGQRLVALPDLVTFGIASLAIRIDATHVDRVDDHLRIEAQGRIRGPPWA